MKTRNIFIDTQAFMQQGFKFENTILSRIKELGRLSLINIYISEVVKREVSSKISEKLANAYKHRSDFLKEMSVLESEVPEELTRSLSDFDEASIKNIGETRWVSYIEESKTKVLDPNDICNNELLSFYFDGSFPFSEGKKKNEFPDAISMLSLKAWVKNSNQSVYVVSNDQDLKGFCENEESCISLSQLSEFLDIYNRAEERLTNIVHKYIDNEQEWISDVIKEAFCQSGFIYDSNYEAEVENVMVTELTIQDVDVIVVEDGGAVIDLRAAISCTADVSGPDYDSSIWDSEDEEYLFLESFDENMEFYSIYDITIELFFDEEQGEITKIADVLFGGCRDITLYDE